MLNAVRLIECLDETRSTFTKWTADDDRPDVLGDYEMVIDLAIRPDVIPPGIHVFRIARWQIALVVSAEVKRMMEAAGCRGARFTKVT